MPPLEAAAAGRLVIGTPVGHLPRLAYEGLGLLAPLDGAAFVEFCISTLTYFRHNPGALREMTAQIQAAAEGRDWRYMLADWEEFLGR